MSFPPRHSKVESPARLHLGFVDLNGGLGRRFGSLGLALEGLSTTVTAQSSPGFRVDGDDAARAEKYAVRTLQAFGLPRQLALTVESAIPAHAGLGSGTQLALAVAVAIAQLFGVERNIRDFASITGRGQRSGIGIGAFEAGGFVMDGGLADDTAVPPLLARFDFPDEWRVILVCDGNHQGLSGAAEVSAFESIQPMHQATAAELCRLTLMGVFPALVEHNFASFSTHIATIQTLIGEYFGPCQGGQFTSASVAEAIAWVKETHAVSGVGQTSWGPTGFAFVEDAARAQRITDELAQRFAGTTDLSFSVHRGRNRGANVERTEQLNSPTVATG